MADNSFNHIFNDYNSKAARESRARQEAARKAREDAAREARLRAAQQAREAAIERFKNDSLAASNAIGFSEYVISTDEEMRHASNHFLISEDKREGKAQKVVVVTTTPGLKEELEEKAVELGFDKGYYCFIERV
ncbi:hypothetical protein TSUD_347380 [Trifolium subterraneum]|nr:hypothetical protein TSUD_347380 [Trifolium subterraneum]